MAMLASSAEASSGAGSISGAVTTPSGSGIKNVYVYAINASTMATARSAITNTSGEYTVSNLPPGNYKLYYTIGGVGCVFTWYKNSDTWCTATVITISALGSIEHIDVIMQTTGLGSISGAVASEAGAGIEGVSVAVFSESTGYSATATTKADGSYEATGLPPGWYKITFDASGTRYISEYYNDHIAYAAADNVSVASSSATTGVNAVLSMGGSVSGVVSDFSGTGIQGVKVRAYEMSTSAHGSAITDADGKYEVTGLPSGNYQIDFTASRTELIGETYNDHVLYADLDAVHVTAPTMTTDVNAVLQRGGLISGTVADSSGTGIQGVYVSSYESSSFQINQTVTDANGRYALTGLASGTYFIDFETVETGYIFEIYDGKHSIYEAEGIAVTAPNATTNIDAILEKGASISGTLVNSSGAGIFNARVTAYDASSQRFIASTHSDCNGNYTLTGLPSGSYKILFKAPSPDASTSWFGADNPVAVTAPNATTDINAVLDLPSRTIEASVEGNGSISPSGAVVAEKWSDQMFSIIPAQGNRILDVLVDGASVGPVASYTFSDIASNHSIEALFSPISQSWLMLLLDE